MKKPILIMLLGVFFVFAGMMIMTDGTAIADTDDTVWYLENSYQVCSSCHVENKTGHFGKKGCDSCHEPGEKKEVHSAPLLQWNVDGVDEWRTQCSSCHLDDGNKSGHIAQKKECLRCHGPDGKKDVHNYTTDVGGGMECADCHLVDENGIMVDGPTKHLEDCTVCHSLF